MIAYVRRVLLSHHRFKSCFCAFSLDRRAVTSIEFGILLLPFAILVFVIFNAAMMYYSQMAIDSAVTGIARQIQIGAAAKDGWTRETVRSRVCGPKDRLLDCSKLYIDLASYDSFAAIPKDAPVRNGKLDFGSARFDTGRPGMIMALRVYFIWPATVLTQDTITNIDGGGFLVGAARVFKVEAF